MCNRFRRPLKALPIEAKRLFADRMVEAIDLDPEERKAQSGRSQGPQQQKEQYSKPATAPARQSLSQVDSSQGRSGGSNRNQTGWGKASRSCFPKGKAGNCQPKGSKPLDRASHPKPSALWTYSHIFGSQFSQVMFKESYNQDCSEDISSTILSKKNSQSVPRTSTPALTLRSGVCIPKPLPDTPVGGRDPLFA